jgi:hypothetical protein
MPWYEVEYSSNNSGGSFWLSDDDWYALRDAGWDVDWVAESEFHQRYHPGEVRSMGALAMNASKTVQAPDESYAYRMVVDEFERITNEYANEHGCSCCGPPHNFYSSEVDGPSFDKAYATVEEAIRDALNAGISPLQIEDITDRIAYG